MKQVFTATDSAELELLKNMLLEAGVRCALRNEQLSETFPAVAFNAELWVENDEDLERAQELCQTWFHPSAAHPSTWTCSQCGQRLGRQFDSCWKCGTKRETAAQFNQEGEEDESGSSANDHQPPHNGLFFDLLHPLRGAATASGSPVQLSTKRMKLKNARTGQGLARAILWRAGVGFAWFCSRTSPQCGQASA